MDTTNGGGRNRQAPYFLVLLLLTASCGGDGPTGPGVSSLVLSRTEVKMLTDGTVQVEAQPLNENGEVVPGVTIEWSSTSPSVATVSAAGLVTTLTPGNTFIRAEAGQSSDSIRLEVASERFASVAAAGFKTCALTTAGEAYCWGDNTYGGLGTGDTLSSPTPLAVRTDVRFSSLALSERTSCGIAVNGDAYCWGANGRTQLGLGGSNVQDRSEPNLVVGGVKFSSLSAGYASTCGVTAGGVGYCWGSNETGQLGNGLGANFSFPSPIAGGLMFSSLDVGHLHVCGVTTGGAAYCWGADLAGSLGIGTDLGPCSISQIPCSATPVAVTGGYTFTSVSAAGSHACGITTAGAGYCWGSGGHLGDGTSESWTVPVPVTGGRTFTSLTTGGDLSDPTKAHTCAIESSGEAYCWGSNAAGQLGTGERTPGSIVPVLVAGGFTWQSLAAGADHSCGLATDGILYCWGVTFGSVELARVPGQS